MIVVCKSDNPERIDIEFIATDKDCHRIANRFYIDIELEYFNFSLVADKFYER